MDTEFLRTILPPSDDWFQLVRIDKREDGSSAVSHHPLKISAPDQAWEKKLSFISSDKFNDGKPSTNGVFFTPWSFDVDKVTQEEAGHYQDGKPKPRTPRKHDAHKVSCRALWLDVDVKEGGHYDTEKDALNAVLHQLTPDMPKPTAIVKTGGGYHFYWVLAEALGLDDWLQAAVRFDQYWKDAEVKFDPISCDSARVLRIPGTVNMKTGEPRECKTVLMGNLIHNDFIARWPEAAVPQNILPPDIHGLFQAGADTDLGAPKDHGPRYTAEAIKECGVLSGIAADGGAQCSEPLWHNVLQFNRHTQDGESYNVIMSDKHTDYTPEGLAQKVALLDPSVKPIACETFRRSYMTDYGVDPCAQCQHSSNEKIISPLAVARTPEHKQAQDTLRIANMLLPAQLKAGNGECMTYTLVPSTKDNEPPKKQKLLGVELVEVSQSDRMDDQGQWDNQLNITYRHATRGLCTSVVALLHLSKREAHNAIVKAGLAPVGESASILVGNIFMSWSSDLSQSGLADESYARQGWQGEGTDTFVVGDQVLKAGKRFAIASPSSATPPLAGTLAEWQDMAHRLLEANNPAHRIALAASIGTPLGRICKSPDAMAGISLYCKDSGVGKTTSVRMAANFWGSAEDMASSTDTINGAEAAASERPHTPFIWDDPKTDRIRAGVKELLFSITHGRGKQRATNSGAAAGVRKHETLMIITSNKPFHGELSVNEGEGEAARLLEIMVPPIPQGSSAAFDDVKEVRGVAGAAFMEKVMANQQLVRDFYAKVSETVEERLYQPDVTGNAERYYKRTAKLAVLGAMLAKHWNILNIDARAVLDDYVTLIVKLRTGVNARHDANSIAQLVEDFMVSDRVTGGVVNVFADGGKGRRSDVITYPSAQHEGDAWHYVVATETCEVRIVKAKMVEWYDRTQGIKWNESAILEQAVSEGVLVGASAPGVKRKAKKLTMDVADKPYPKGRPVGYHFTFPALANFDTRQLKDKLRVVTTPSDASSSEPLL